MSVICPAKSMVCRAQQGECAVEPRGAGARQRPAEQLRGSGAAIGYEGAGSPAGLCGESAVHRLAQTGRVAGQPARRDADRTNVPAAKRVDERRAGGMADKDPAPERIGAGPQQARGGTDPDSVGGSAVSGARDELDPPLGAELGEVRGAAVVRPAHTPAPGARALLRLTRAP